MAGIVEGKCRSQKTAVGSGTAGIVVVVDPDLAGEEVRNPNDRAKCLFVAPEPSMTGFEIAKIAVVIVAAAAVVVGKRPLLAAVVPSKDSGSIHLVAVVAKYQLPFALKNQVPSPSLAVLVVGMATHHNLSGPGTLASHKVLDSHMASSPDKQAAIRALHRIDIQDSIPQWAWIREEQ